MGQEQVYTVDPDGSDLQLVANDAEAGQWSPDGTKIAIFQVDYGDDGSADFRFARDKSAKIAVDARAGDDRVRIDDSNGAFTDSIPTAIDGGDGKTRSPAAKAAASARRRRHRLDRRQRRHDLALLGAGDDTFV
jgi:hypothetical protein